MIKNLQGEYETVEYENKRFVMLYDNVETEFYPTHWHNAVEIIYPLVNPYAVKTGGDEFRIGEHELLLIPPGELHTLPAQPGRRLIFQCDNRVLSGEPALESVMPVFHAPVMITHASADALRKHAEQTMTEIYKAYYSTDELSDIRIYTLLIGLLAAIRADQIENCRQSLACAQDKMHQYSEKFRQVLKYIDQNYMYDITLDTLADLAGYSKFHFSRLFKEYNAVSYLRYINIRRIRAAEALLLDPELPITEVAIRSGFSSLSTFNRIFKEIKHCTPSSYQRLYSAGWEPPVSGRKKHRSAQ